MANESQRTHSNSIFSSASGSVPLTWVSSTQELNISNFGDALNPVIISAMTGLPCVKRNFDDKRTRLAAVGTIGHLQKNGTVHLWGTGVDPKRNAVDSSILEYIRPSDTNFHVHALRGPFSRSCLMSKGIACPPIYGDAGYFLPKIVKASEEKLYELGVVIHISELESKCIHSSHKEQYIRYNGGDMDGVKIINTYHDTNWESFTDKIKEITSCKRVVSMSFHGLIIAEAYGIPAIYFSPQHHGPKRLNIIDSYANIDHRIADFYCGSGRDSIAIYGQSRLATSNWAYIIESVDKLWSPFELNASSFFESFPTEKIVDLKDENWNLRKELIETIIW